MKICFTCYTMFESHLEIGLEMPCPIHNCGGQVVEIDDNIFHTIKTLNVKGYTTKYCCSGHTWEELTPTYIAFDPIVNKECFSHYPNGFVKEYTNSRVSITKKIETKDVLEKQKALNDAAYDLLEWSEKLPIANEVTVYLDQDLYKLDSKLINAVRNELNIVTISQVQTRDGESYSILVTTTSPESTDKLVKTIRAFTRREKLKCQIEAEQFIP